MKRLKFTKEKCIGCKLCAVVCSAYKTGEYCPSKARIDIQSYYEGDGMVYDDRFCILCGICAKSCPAGAISQGDYISVDHSKCIGCGTCLAKCPKKAPKLFEKKSYICDTCEGSPNCVRTCPQQALRYA